MRKILTELPSCCSEAVSHFYYCAQQGCDRDWLFHENFLVTQVVGGEDGGD